MLCEMLREMLFEVLAFRTAWLVLGLLELALGIIGPLAKTNKPKHTNLHSLNTLDKR